MIDLITQKPKGVLPLLDEELVMPKGSDQTFLQKLINNCGNNPVFKRVLKNRNGFMIKHYAGGVEYDVVGFLEKNRDSLTEVDVTSSFVPRFSTFFGVLPDRWFCYSVRIFL